MSNRFLISLSVWTPGLKRKAKMRPTNWNLEIPDVLLATFTSIWLTHAKLFWIKFKSKSKVSCQVTDVEVISVTTKSRYSDFRVITSLGIFESVDSGRYETLLWKGFISFYTFPSFPSFLNARVYLRQHTTSIQSTFQKCRENCSWFVLSEYFFIMCRFIVLCAVGKY